ncbi:hypothetical protein HPP92_020242 [Vanilla planifolia]|uniref:Nudix hydrolase domain-containing protein n=1 Tax=Vanilla planifolia TaxID=51239 RepID=A0A835PWJ7_VANPL|nr:hypothetical protein HPP92_020651 [Vanilla planifolia]KAG0461766.1 hypothetical protein HPP92_020242 [Vanilla planifolia]
MAACGRLLLSVIALGRLPCNLLDLHPGNGGFAAANTLRHLRGVKFVSRMASGDSQAPVSLKQTMQLPTGDSFEVAAASGLSESEFRIAIDSTLFKQWLKNMQSKRGILSDGNMHLRRVEVQGIDMFGDRIGFLKFRAEVLDSLTGVKAPGIVFARGPSVAVLILLESVGKTYAVLTEQVRVPVGRLILELPAGMVDDEGGDLVGTAVREVEEEIGISLNVRDMVNLTAFLDSATDCRVFPSPGGCDEELNLFLYRAHVNEEIIRSLQGKEMGLRDHGELIKVHVVPYDELWRMTADAKALASIAIYEMAKRDGLLPQSSA